MAVLRGSKERAYNSIAATLELVLSSSTNESQLRSGVKTVIKICKEWAVAKGSPKINIQEIIKTKTP